MQGAQNIATKTCRISSFTLDVRIEAEEAAVMLYARQLAASEEHSYCKGRNEIEERDCALQEAIPNPLFADDIQSLAQWAFGLEGLSELQLIACGNFFHHNRFQQHTMLLYRNELAFVKDAAMDFSSQDPIAAAPHPTYRYLR